MNFMWTKQVKSEAKMMILLPIRETVIIMSECGAGGLGCERVEVREVCSVFYGYNLTKQ